MFSVHRYQFQFDVIGQYFGVLLSGVTATLLITVLSFIFATLIGLVVSQLRLSKVPPIVWLTSAYIDIFRCTPALMQVLWIYYVLPILFNVSLSAIAAGILALSLNNGAFLGEIFRAGIQSIDPGQRDAARVLGLHRRETFTLIVLPQAIRRVLPAITSTAISLLKDSSLVSVIAVSELMYEGQTVSSQTFRPLEVLTFVAIIYFVLTYPLSILNNYLERRYRVADR
jgi:polar amino acid transport system permease protein